jgi:hypothetical protein
MDHRKTWEYHVRAEPSQCVAAFGSAMNGGSKASLMASRWRVTRQGAGAVAVYEGRGGITGFFTQLTERGTNEQDSAVGSKVEFTTEPGPGGVTVCHMHLAEWAAGMGFTSDARFIRPAMQRVEGALRALDPSLTVIKH